jgi:RNA polymerase sigma-70 factor (ECF subfamily)
MTTPERPSIALAAVDDADAERTDEALVARARARDRAAFELLMRRYNRRVYRVVRSVLHDPVEIEDVMQQAYLAAFVHLEQFEGAARWSTWVCRIAFNEALARLRQRGRFVSIDIVSDDAMADISKSAIDPERIAAGKELGQLLEQAIERLPEIYRAVLVLREIEGMSISESAEVLGVDPNVVKTRLSRAKSALHTALEKRVGEQMKLAYSFGDERCDRVVAAVHERLAALESPRSG